MIKIFTAILAVTASAFLWHMGGQSRKWARVLVGGVIGIAKALLVWNIFALLYWPILYAMTSLFSYGLTAPPHRFWVWMYGKGGDGNYPPVEIATRATCGFFWSMAAAPFAFITGRWAWQIAYTVILTVLTVVFGMCKKVEISETGTGASVALSVFV